MPDGLNIIRVYVVRDTTTGLYEAGEGSWQGPPDNKKWIARCTARNQDDATEMTEEEFLETFPDGLPNGWEKIKIYEFEARKRK